MVTPTSNIRTPHPRDIKQKNVNNFMKMVFVAMVIDANLDIWTRKYLNNILGQFVIVIL
jgi:hypothetical protein